MGRKYDPIAIAVLAIATAAVLLVTVIVPWLQSRPVAAPGPACINNLRVIDGATQRWAIEYHKDTNAVPTWNEILPYMRSAPKCPKGGKYTLGSPSRLPTCSIPGHTIP